MTTAPSSSPPPRRSPSPVRGSRFSGGARRMSAGSWRWRGGARSGRTSSTSCATCASSGIAEGLKAPYGCPSRHPCHRNSTLLMPRFRRAFRRSRHRSMAPATGRLFHQRRCAPGNGAQGRDAGRASSASPSRRPAPHGRAGMIRRMPICASPRASRPWRMCAPRREGIALCILIAALETERDYAPQQLNSRGACASCTHDRARNHVGRASLQLAEMVPHALHAVESAGLGNIAQPGIGGLQQSERHGRRARSRAISAGCSRWIPSCAASACARSFRSSRAIRARGQASASRVRIRSSRAREGRHADGRRVFAPTCS